MQNQLDSLVRPQFEDYNWTVTNLTLTPSRLLS
jgi:hypothetical protein